MISYFLMNEYIYIRIKNKNKKRNIISFYLVGQFLYLVHIYTLHMSDNK
jgi:hypothetical protein